MKEKSSLRTLARRYFAALSPDEHVQAGREIAGHLADSKLWAAAETLFVFVSMADEIDTRPIIDHALADRKRVGIPRIVGQDLEFASWDGKTTSLESGPYGIPQPRGEATILNPPGVETLPILVVTPGLAFGRNGSRLGRGGGYYDRFLTTYGESLVAVGICPCHLLYDAVPESTYDVRVDAVVCEAGITVTKSR